MEGIFRTLNKRGGRGIPNIFFSPQIDENMCFFANNAVHLPELSRKMVVVK
jgi:hypothetical protein